MMNPQNGKGSGRLHARQQCSNEEMTSKWNKALKAPSTICGCKGLPIEGASAVCKYVSVTGYKCFAPNAYECEHKRES